MTEKQKRDKIQSVLTKRKREEREAVASGKGAFYLKVKRSCMMVMTTSADQVD